MTIKKAVGPVSDYDATPHSPFATCHGSFSFGARDTLRGALADVCFAIDASSRTRCRRCRRVGAGRLRPAAPNGLHHLQSLSIPVRLYIRMETSTSTDDW